MELTTDQLMLSALGSLQDATASRACGLTVLGFPEGEVEGSCVGAWINERHRSSSSIWTTVQLMLPSLGSLQDKKASLKPEDSPCLGEVEGSFVGAWHQGQREAGESSSRMTVYS